MKPRPISMAAFQKNYLLKIKTHKVNVIKNDKDIINLIDETQTFKIQVTQLEPENSGIRRQLLDSSYDSIIKKPILVKKWFNNLLFKLFAL